MIEFVQMRTKRDAGKCSAEVNGLVTGDCDTSDCIARIACSTTNFRILNTN